MGDMKIGMRVRKWDQGRDYLLLAQHPQNGHWWLQDAETGAIGINLRESERNLILVADDYRAKTDILELVDGTKLVVKFRAGRWAVCGTKVYYDSPHEGAKYLGEPYNLVGGAVPWKVKVTQAKRLASELDAAIPDYWAVPVTDRRPIVQAAILRAFGVTEAAA